MTTQPDHKPRVRMPSYRRHRPSGQAVVTLAGRDHYLGPWRSTESKHEYDRLLALWLADGGKRARTPEPETMTVADLVARWWANAEARLRSRHAGDARRVKHELGRIHPSSKLLLKLFGSTRAADFGPKDLKALRGSWVASTALCRSMINYRVQIVRQMFAWGVSEELLPPSLAHALDTVANLHRGEPGAREGRKITAVPWENVEPVLPLVSRQVAAMIRLQWWCGCRPGEALAMRPCDLDRSGPTWCYRPARHKTEHHGRAREVWLGQHAQEVLKPFLDRVPRPDPMRPVFRANEAKAEHEQERSERRVTPPWPSHMRRNAAKRKRRPMRAPGEQYSVPSYRRAIERAIDTLNTTTVRAALVETGCAHAPGADSSTVEATVVRIVIGSPIGASGAVCVDATQLADALSDMVPAEKIASVVKRIGEMISKLRLLPRWHPHMLRHACATRLRKEHGLEAARCVLGHTSPAVTTHYAEVDAEKAKVVMERLG